MSAEYRHKYGYGGSRRVDSAYGEDGAPKPAAKPTAPPPKTVSPPVHHRLPPQPIIRAPIPAAPVLAPTSPTPETSVRKVSRKRLYVSGAIVIVALVAIGLFFMTRSNESDTAPSEMVAQVISELSIQNDTNPAILGVIDETKTNQPFLEEAENGDKVLLFYKAKTSVLYRPSERRIVKQGSFTPPDAKVFVRDATADDTVVVQAKNKLNEINGVELTSQDESINTYSGNQIINVTGRYDDMVKTLAEEFDAKIINLPATENAPEADILLIIAS